MGQDRSATGMNRTGKLVFDLGLLMVILALVILGQAMIEDGVLDTGAVPMYKAAIATATLIIMGHAGWLFVPETEGSA